MVCVWSNQVNGCGQIITTKNTFQRFAAVFHFYHIPSAAHATFLSRLCAFGLEYRKILFRIKPSSFFKTFIRSTLASLRTLGWVYCAQREVLFFASWPFFAEHFVHCIWRVSCGKPTCRTAQPWHWRKKSPKLLIKWLKRFRFATMYQLLMSRPAHSPAPICSSS